MSIRIRIDGLTLPDRGKSLPLSVEHDGKVCMGAKIVGEAVYIPSKGDSLRAMTDEELAHELLDLFAAFTEVEWTEGRLLELLREDAGE